MDSAMIMNYQRNQIMNQLDTTKAKTPKVLIVEDDMTQEEMWYSIISKVNQDAKIEWVTSEVKAEELINQALSSGENYDLVIADIFLSGDRTGLDLWNSFYKTMKGRIILTSGIDYANFMKVVGADNPQPLYIQKPFVIHECIEILYEKLNNLNKN